VDVRLRAGHPPPSYARASIQRHEEDVQRKRQDCGSNGYERQHGQILVSDGATLEALEQLYRDRYADFLRTASAIANSRELGRDAVQDAFVSAVRARSKFRGDGALEAWVWPMVVRSALKARRTTVKPSECPEEPTWRDDEIEGAAEIRAAIARLPERQRLVLFLRYFGDLAYRDIAEAAGIDVGTVGAQLHAAHQSLRQLLKEVSPRA
jgi:RNA polymerase sigma factor (sigma-70 family)